MDERQIREAIDACRPGSDDLGLPELVELADLIQRDRRVKELYARTQRLDGAIGDAFRDLPVPDGLLGRLLAAAAAEASSADSLVVRPRSESVDGLPGGSVGDSAAPPDRRWRGAKGRLVWIASLSAAAIVLIAVGSLLRRPGAPIDGRRIPDVVDQWVGLVGRAEPPWNGDLDSKFCDSYPLPALLTVRPSAWRPFQARLVDRDGAVVLEKRAVAYDLRRSGDRGQSLLFVLRTRREVDVDDVTAIRPTQGTGGWLVGVWREQRVLYVLAVEGDQRRYRRFLKSLPATAQRLRDLRPIA